MALRTIIIYVASLVIVRLSSARFLSKTSPFDIVVGIMLGSIMSRAINGSASLVPTIIAGAVLLALHWVLAALAYHTSWFGPIIKGGRILLIKDGEICRKGMRQASITEHDLNETLRLETREPDPSKIKAAYMERNGQISIVPRDREPRIYTVAVEDNVQMIRIELK